LFRLCPCLLSCSSLFPFFPLPSLSYMQGGHPRHPCTWLTKREIEEDNQKSHIHTCTYTQHPPTQTTPFSFVPILTLGLIFIRRKVFVSSYHPRFTFGP
jgi:hypothetical protein